MGLTPHRLQVTYKRLHHRPGWGTSMTRTDLPDLTVGWLGTGHMGAALAARIGRAGLDLTVWNRTRSKRGAAGRRGPKGGRGAGRTRRPRRRLHDGHVVGRSGAGR